MTFDGNINFNPGAYLIFEFDPQADDPKVILNLDSNNLQLDEGVRLEFSGKGTVQLNNDKTITLLKNAAQTTKFVLSNSSIFTVQEPINGVPSTATISGNGQILVDSGAGIQITGGRQLIVGAASTDALSVLVDRSGWINVDAHNQQLPAYLSFQQATYELTFQQEASLEIGDNGFFEINADKTIKTSGLLTKFSLSDDGELYFNKGGTFIIGQNKLTSGIETQFTFDMYNGSVYGDGLVGLAAPQAGSFGFIGQLFNKNSGDIFTSNIPQDATTFTAQNFVRALINRMPNLIFSTLFFDKDGYQLLFNKKDNLYQLSPAFLPQTIFKLQEGDEIRSDDPSNGYVYGYNSGILFAIPPDGRQRL
jgi:hypothetical protein